MNIVSKEDFEKRTNTNYSYNTFAEAHETNQSFECGCGEDHFIDKDGVKLVKQVDDPLTDIEVNPKLSTTTKAPSQQELTSELYSLIIK